MTFTIGKNQVHIGWWETGLIICAIISSTWGASWWVNNFNNREVARDEKLQSIFEKVKYIARQDTMITQHLITVDTSLLRLQMRQSETDHLLGRPASSGYWNEKRVKGGRYVLTEAR